jgi:hypothetical protein
MTPDALELRATSAAEIAALFGRYDVAMADARVAGQSADGRYVDAYTAGFLLAKIIVRSSGYRVRGGSIWSPRRGTRSTRRGRQWSCLVTSSGRWP